MNTRFVKWIILIAAVAQSLISLMLPVYRDTGWVRDTWFGNDLVTLCVVCPLYFVCLIQKPTLFRLLDLGCLGYFVYNYLYYVLGAELNTLFIVYVLLVIAAALLLIYEVASHSEVRETYGYFGDDKKNKVAGLILLFMGIGLAVVWIGNWAGYVFAERPLPIAAIYFRLVAALDLLLMITPLAISGIGILKNRHYGFLVGVITGTQGILYLLVLVVNSTFISLKNDTFPGETPIWLTLLIIETIGMIILFVPKKAASRISPVSWPPLNTGQSRG